MKGSNRVEMKKKKGLCRTINSPVDIPAGQVTLYKNEVVERDFIKEMNYRGNSL